MKKLSILILIAIVAATAAMAARKYVTPSKKNETRTMTMQPFDEIEVSTAINVVYEQNSGNSHTVSITAPDNIIEYVNVKQKRGCVYIAMDNRLSINGSPDIKIVIKTPSLKEVELSGASSLKAKEIKIPGKKFELDVSGASSVEIDKLTAHTIEFDLSGASKANVSGIVADYVEADASGASHITLSGKCTSVEFDGSGASCIIAKKLKATNGKLEASGASSINASIQNIFRQSASGASSIKVN